MSDILIKGMEMPKDGFVEILIRDDGTVQQTGQSYRIEGTDYYAPYIGETPAMYEAVPILPHGRLIDAGALTYLMGMDEHFSPLEAIYLMELIADAPTIIPASGGNEDENKS